MKKSVSLKLIVFSFLLVTASVSYSAAPEFQGGTGTNSTKAGVGNIASGEKSSAFGYNNTASGRESSAFGHWNEASGNQSSVFGHGNLTNGFASSAFGYGNSADKEGSSAFGYNNTASEKSSSAFGTQNEANGEKSSVFGNQYKVTGEASGAFGVGKTTWNGTTGKDDYDYVNEGKDSYMIGNYNRIASGSNNNFILGNNVSIGSGIQNSVALGNNSVVSSSNEVSVGSATQKRKITNVADGEVSANSTDAVTGKQLYSGEGIDVNAWQNKLDVTKKDASNLSASDISAWKSKLGVGNSISNSATSTGSTGLGADNNVTGEYSTAVGYKNKVSGNHSGAFGDPNVVTGNGSYAFGNDNTIKGDNNFVLGNNVTIDAGIQNSVALGNGSTVSSSNEVSVGSATQKRKITNIADGEVSATSTDAVNGRQLYNAMQNSNNTFKNEVNEKIDNVKNEVRNVGSLSAALAGLHPMQYDPKAPTQVMAALGHYKNKQAVAIGASYHFNDRFMMSTGIALSGEKRTETMANVGFTVKLGKGSGVAYNETPQYVVQNEVKRLTVENQELKEKVNAQGAENKDLKERVQKLEEKLNKLLTTK
ncbi:YadA-like family protein [Fusobacterium animalis]|uniref:YadA-like family protein n=1 Tax=Fusobacterium animalis TaxID=76859 RepID=UPI0035573C92